MATTPLPTPFDLRDMPDKAARTTRQLAEVETSYGPGSAATYAPGSECSICGALPGFNHAAGCENDDELTPAMQARFERMGGF